MAVQNAAEGTTAMGTAFASAGFGEASQQENTNNYQQANVNVGDNPFGFGGVTLTPGRHAIAPIRNQIGSEGYDKLLKKAREIVKDSKTNNAVNIDILLLDRSVDPNIHYQGFVVASQSKEKPEIGVGYNVVLLEATGTAIPPVIQNFQGGEKVEVPRYAETAADDYLNRLVVNMLRAQYGSVPAYMSDTQVIPTSFDPENNDAVKNMVSNAAQAATTSLVMFAEQGRFFTHDLNLVAGLRPNGKPRGNGDADLTFITSNNNAVLYDHLSNPIRASIVIQAVTNYRKDNQNNRSINDGSGPRVVLESVGYVDLIPATPRTMMPMMQPTAYGMAMDQRRLKPVFVIESAISNVSNTPGSIFANVLVAADLGRSAGWVRAFTRKPGNYNEGDLNLTDVRAITIDFPDPMNPGKPTPKPPAGDLAYNEERLMQFLGNYCYPELTLAMDIALAGPSSWYTSIFYAAAKGIPGAITRLNKAVDDLCGGKFAALLAQSPTEPFLPAIQEIEYGFYDDVATKSVGSTNVVDYVAVANYADYQNNPDILERWTNSFLNTNRDHKLRMQDRRNIIREILGPSTTFTGRASRVFWNDKYIALALKAIGSAGITVGSDSASGFSFGPNRAHAEFLRNAGLGTDAVWNSASTGPTGGYGFNPFVTSPWG